MSRGYVSGVERGEHVDARQPGPLAIRGEELVGLLRLGRAPAERGDELDEAQVAREPALETAESLEADDPDRPRPEARLALEPPRDRLGRMALERLQVERPAEPDERPRTAGAQPEPRQLGRCEASELPCRRRSVEPCVRGRRVPDHTRLD